MSVVALALPEAQNAERPAGTGLAVINQSALVAREGTSNPYFAHLWAEVNRGVPVADYTIANIPTLYRGRMYRSRLEARWAAFFDRLGWAYEYEPFDLGSWSPDFLLTDLNVLVEVKPITEWDQATVDKICVAMAEQDRWVLVTRVAPQFESFSGRVLVNLGWLSNAWEWHHALVIWLRNKEEPRLYADLPVPVPAELKEKWPEVTWHTSRHQTGNGGWFQYGEYAQSLWADACNAVQWEPRQ